MWLAAGLLLAAFLLTVLAGFHLGPHVHAGAVALGALCVVCLALAAASGHAVGLAIVLLVGVVLLAVGVGLVAWRALRAPRDGEPSARRIPIEGEHGEALTDLDPSGIVRVQGEDWSAVTLNGAVRSGERVQVINARGVHLEVWGEEHDTPGPFDRDRPTSEERSP